MGCCYGTPAVNGCELDTGNDIKSICFVRYLDVCKHTSHSTGSSQPGAAQASTRTPASGGAPGSPSGGAGNANATTASGPRGATATAPPEPFARADTPKADGNTPKSTAARPLRDTLFVLANGGTNVTPTTSIGRAGRFPRISPDLARLQYRELTPEDYELLCLLDESVPKRGISSETVVNCLPCVLARDCLATECNICLCELQPQMQVARLPCGHVFHMECISRWLTQCKGKCPLCLVPIEGALEDEEPEPHALSFSNCGMTSSCGEAKSQRRPCALDRCREAPEEIMPKVGNGRVRRI